VSAGKPIVDHLDVLPMPEDRMSLRIEDKPAVTGGHINNNSTPFRRSLLHCAMYASLSDNLGSESSLTSDNFSIFTASEATIESTSNVTKRAWMSHIFQKPRSLLSCT
jgi:hypothetical protein